MKTTIAQERVQDARARLDYLSTEYDRKAGYARDYAKQGMSEEAARCTRECAKLRGYIDRAKRLLIKAEARAA
jgi:predicted Zn-dependent protease